MSKKEESRPENERDEKKMYNLIRRIAMIGSVKGKVVGNVFEFEHFATYDDDEGYGE